MGNAQRDYMTEGDYLAGEELPGPRHEYIDGEIFAMAGASKTHGTIALNIGAAFRAHLRGTPCRVWMADMKVQVAVAHAYFYPDVVVTCDPADFSPDAPQNYLTAPKVIVEVLSPTTEKRDRQEKWLAYRELPGLAEYVLIDQEQKWVEVYRRRGDYWTQEIAQQEETVHLESLELSLPLSEIYEDVEITENPDEKAVGEPA